MNVKKYSLLILLLVACIDTSLAGDNYQQSNYLIVLPEKSDNTIKANHTNKTDLNKNKSKENDIQTKITVSQNAGISSKIAKLTQEPKKESLQDKLNKMKNYTIRYADNISPYTGNQEQQVKAVLESVESKKQNVYIFENDPEKILSVASTPKEAKALGQKIRAVFYLQSGQSLRQNLSRWSHEEGYQFVWQCQQDLNIQYASTIYGEFLGHSGALTQVLNSTQNTTMPLEAQIMANKVIVIKPYTYNSQILAS